PEYAEAQNTILSLTTQVTDVTIIQTTKPHLPKLIEILSTLKKVTNLRLFNPPGMFLLSIEDIKKFVVHLPHLIELFIVDWRKPDKSEWLLWNMPNIFSRWSSQVDPCQNNTGYLSPKLEELTLKIGYITGPQFRFFAGPPHLPSTLQSVTLRLVHGLANTDLLDFLTHVSLTIKYLTILDCQLSRARDEEYAVDTVMPQMVRLTYLQLSGDIASDLTISRKSSQTVIPGSKIMLTYPSTAHFWNLSGALAVTGWESVILQWNPEDLPHPALVEAAKLRAFLTGIQFSSIVLTANI
ncbi:hypothetical protein C0991_005508, partial [Blastosporella zonata]